MPRMIVSLDGTVIREVTFSKERTTLGRRPYNDVVVDDLSVSGEHAAFTLSGAEVWLEDLNSTNGTYVNGKAVKRQQLRHEDKIEIAKLRIQFVVEGSARSVAVDRAVAPPRPMMSQPPAPGASAANATPAASGAVTEVASVASAPQGAIKVLSGAAAGREVPLTKVVTTIGKPGVAVAAITRRQHGFVVHHVEGGGNPTVNGAPFTAEPVALHSGDVVELAGTRLQFVQH
ncbi:FHA domain-containing protein [Rhodoferax sp. OV413]|uniref:FHA domain-containing protein n=1 Tax=Rhodoferax sp. OV413 TaxID=1855285 RepID=UPI0025D75CE3|nr:FHA domain-containing protein [Rhodoferax sp. OV413]